MKTLLGLLVMYDFSSTFQEEQLSAADTTAHRISARREDIFLGRAVSTGLVETLHALAVTLTGERLIYSCCTAALLAGGIKFTFGPKWVFFQHRAIQLLARLLQLKDTTFLPINQKQADL